MEYLGFGHYRIPLPWISLPDKPARYVDVKRCFREVYITEEFQQYAADFHGWCKWFCDRLDEWAEKQGFHRMPGPIHFYKVPPELLTDYQREHYAAQHFDLFRADCWYYSNPSSLYD